jgi:hypothetical protein
MLRTDMMPRNYDLSPTLRRSTCDFQPFRFPFPAGPFPLSRFPVPALEVSA